MLRSYFAAALRNLLRNRAVSLVNIAGLAIGFAAVLLIALYVRYESSYDQFIPGHERAYQLSMQAESQPGMWDNFEDAPNGAASWLKLDFPEIESTSRVTLEWLNVAAGEREFNEPVYYADPDFFRMFPIPAVAGDLASALDVPDEVAISRSMARKYFSVDNPVGKRLEIERRSPDRHVSRRISAVFEDLPGNSHFNFQFMVSSKGRSLFAAVEATKDARPWGVHTYFKLRPGVDRTQIESQLPAFIARHWNAAEVGHTHLIVRPVTDIHLAPAARGAMKPRGNAEALAALCLVGAIILLIAVTNYVNLTTARAADRGVEVGVRKLHGARVRDLWLQFTTESLLYVLLAMLLAVSLVELALPYFNSMLDPGNPQFAPPGIRFDYWRNPTLLAVLAGAAVLIGVIAGAWPSFVLSRLAPARLVKGVLTGNSGARIRRLLVVMQFAMLVGLIFASSVIYRQTAYALNAAMHIDTDQVVIYNLWGGSAPGRPSQTFLDELPKVQGVRGVTSSSTLPTNYQMAKLPFTVPGIEPVPAQVAAVDFNFFEFYRVPLRAGRWLSPQFASDRFELASSERALSVLINETAAASFGLTPSGAIGKTLRLGYWPSEALKPPATITIVGVTGDVPNESLRRPADPMIFFFYDSALGTVSIRISGDDVPATMQRLRQAWKQFGQPRAQEGWFLDSFYRDLYADVILQKKTLSLFTGCAIFLAVLGLLGLSAWTVQRRTREIGIRKVMGADTHHIMRMLLWAFSKPVLWASLLAWPLAAWLMHRWLDGFAYRVPLGWWWLPVASTIALLVALLTVSAHALIAARARPVQSLRHE